MTDNQVYTKEKKPASLKNACRFLVLVTTLSTLSSLRNPKSEIRNQVHDFHTSITEMRYNAKEKTFEISLRLFTDDLEKALSIANQNQKIVLLNNDKNDGLVEQYIRKYFSVINTKNQKLLYQYIGKEKEGDATWIYLEMPVNESISGYKLQNNVLIDTFDDQTNIVNIFVQNQKKSYLYNMKSRIFVIEI